MNLLELYLTPLDAENFKIFVGQSTLSTDAEAPSTLPFWEDGRDWRTTVIKVLESRRFEADAFRSADEREWMIGAKILSEPKSGSQNFHPDYLKNIGQALYDSLFPSKVREVLNAAIRDTERQHQNTFLHLRLKFSADSAERSRLADYPWELIHNGTHFLLHRQVRISRYIAHDAIPPSLPRHERIQILLVAPEASDPEHGLYALPNEEQAILAGIRKAQDTGLISFTHQPFPTVQSLSRYLTEDCDPVPQILHFDGHGIFGKKCNICQTVTPGIKATCCPKCKQLLPEPKGYLLFNTDQGKPHYVDANSFASRLHPEIQLIVLSACQSGMSVSGESVFNGTAQQLIDARYPAVVAMQYKVLVEKAGAFIEQFYRLLSQKKSLLDALNKGRVWMDFESNQWYRPVLYLRWQDNEGGQLFHASNSIVQHTLTQTTEKVADGFLPKVKGPRKRLALLIGVSRYSKDFLSLPAANKDIKAFQKVLESPHLGNFDNVKIISNPDAEAMRTEIEIFFENRDPDDLVFLFFSGHGIRDESNSLYFGTQNTYKTTSGELVKSSAVSAQFIHDTMDKCESQQQVLVLDCCYSGAFSQELVPKDDQIIDIRNQLVGEGRVILSSSSSVQSSFERKQDSLSLYTKYLIEGIYTGKADLDGNNIITVDELHEYTKAKVKRVLPAINPKIDLLNSGGKIQISNVRESPKSNRIEYLERVLNQAYWYNLYSKYRPLMTRLLIVLICLFVLARVECRIAYHFWANNEWFGNMIRPADNPQKKFCKFIGAPIQ